MPPRTLGTAWPLGIDLGSSFPQASHPHPVEQLWEKEGVAGALALDGLGGHRETDVAGFVYHVFTVRPKVSRWALPGRGLSMAASSKH